MLLIRPQTIAPGSPIVTSTNVVESVAAYAGGTTYGLGDTGRYNYRIYESLQASNTGHQPDLTASATWWLDIGPANQWAMFDLINGTVSTATGSIDITLTLTGRVDSVALFNVSGASSVRVVVSTVADGTVYDVTTSMTSTSGINDWYSYFFEDIVLLDTFFKTALPLYPNPIVRIVITGATVTCGTVVVGQSKNLGKTLHDGAAVGITDYSRKETDDFGNYTLVERAFARRGSFQLRLPRASVDEVQRILSDYRATPAVYAATTEYSSTQIFGFFREFNIEIDRPLESLCSIEIEGLT